MVFNKTSKQGYFTAMFLKQLNINAKNTIRVLIKYNFKTKSSI